MNCRFLRAAAAFLLAGAMLFTLAGCRESESGNDPKKGFNGYFTSVISGSPGTLDPQTCTGDAASQVIANVFRGLYRTADGGKAVPAMAQSVSVSENGLVWNFTLTPGVMWYGSDFSAECTADDFVFGFQRLMNPALRSERAKEYYCIKNAEQINTGLIKDLTALGVEAVSDYELRITLNEPRTDFEQLLAAPPAMPCNRDFCEHTEGQYGLVEECVGSNGAFYISKWHYDKWVKDGNFIEMRRNELNAEMLNTAPRAVKLLINADGYESFLNGVTDVYRTSVPDEIFRLSGKYGSNAYSDGVWGVLFNCGGVFASADLRIALGGFVGADTDGGIYSPADCIIPDTALIGELNYRAAAGMPTRVSYSEDELPERGLRAMRTLEDGALSGMRLIVPEGTALKQSMGNVIQQWQKNFGVYCMMTELSAGDYVSALQNGSFEAALVRLGGNGSAVSYLTCFASSSSRNYGRSESAKLDDILDGALTAQTDTSAAGSCLEAEQFVLDSSLFAPLCFEKEYVFTGAGISGIEYDPSCGGFIFAGATE